MEGPGEIGPTRLDGPTLGLPIFNRLGMFWGPPNNLYIRNMHKRAKKELNMLPPLAAAVALC